MAQAVLCQRNSITHYFFTSFDPPKIYSYRQSWKKFSAVGYQGMLDQFFRDIPGDFLGRKAEVYDLLQKCTPLSGLACISVLACHIFNVEPSLSPTPLLTPKKDPADPTSRIELTPEESRHFSEINQALRHCSGTRLNKTLIAFLILGVEPDVIARHIKFEWRIAYSYFRFALAIRHEGMFGALIALLGRRNSVQDKPEFIQEIFELEIQEGRTEGLEILQKWGADIESRTRYYGRYYVHQAAARGQVAVITELVRLGADISAPDDAGRAPLHHAAIKGKVEVLRELKRLGVDLNAPDTLGNTPAHHAVLKGQVEVLRFLKESGVNLCLPNRYGDTVMHIAAEIGNREILRDLMEWGVNLEVKNQRGWTPVHNAAYYRKYDILKMFGDRGVNLNAQDADGKTPAHYLMEKSKVRGFYDPISLIYHSAFLSPMSMSSHHRIELESKGMDFYLFDHKGKLPGGDDITQKTMALGLFLLTGSIVSCIAYSFNSKDHHLVRRRTVLGNENLSGALAVAFSGFTFVHYIGACTPLGKRVQNAFRNAMRRWV